MSGTQTMSSSGSPGPRPKPSRSKATWRAFLRDDLKLELSPGKTLITHARTGAARFLGYEITVQHADHKVTGGRRAVNGTIALRVPRDVVKAKCAPYLKLGKPEVRPWLVNEDDHVIVSAYGAEYRGLVSYYLLAGDAWRLNRVRWVMETPCSRRWPASTARRWPRWRPATGPRSARRTGRSHATS
jgi:hypothetical protein